MLNVFFQKGEKLEFLHDSTYLRVSNNLDSKAYVLERIKDPPSNYFQKHYFGIHHAHVVTYYTSWTQNETIVQETSKRPPREKKTLIASLQRKRSKKESGLEVSRHLLREESTVTVQNCLYIQVQSFEQANAGQTLQQILQFMGITFLLASQVQATLNCWPMMVPVTVEEKKLKFIKKGEDLSTELARLLRFSFAQKYNVLKQWSQQLANLFQTGASNLEIGSLTKIHIQKYLSWSNHLRLKQMSGTTDIKIKIIDCDTLQVEGSQAENIYISEYRIKYLIKTASLRQVVLEHDIFDGITFEGERTELVIQYLKQLIN